MSEKSSKGRPAQISRKDVVECALNLGLENVSMHALGKQLGVSATALYRHVGSKSVGRFMLRLCTRESRIAARERLGSIPLHVCEKL